MQVENDSKIKKIKEVNKRICSEQEAGTSKPVVSREHILNFPLSEDNGKCCHMKVF